MNRVCSHSFGAHVLILEGTSWLTTFFIYWLFTPIFNFEFSNFFILFVCFLLVNGICEANTPLLIKHQTAKTEKPLITFKRKIRLSFSFSLTLPFSLPRYYALR